MASQNSTEAAQRWWGARRATRVLEDSITAVYEAQPEGFEGALSALPGPVKQFPKAVDFNRSEVLRAIEAMRVAEEVLNRPTTPEQHLYTAVPNDTPTFDADTGQVSSGGGRFLLSAEHDPLTAAMASRHDKVIQELLAAIPLEAPSLDQRVGPRIPAGPDDIRI